MRAFQASRGGISIATSRIRNEIVHPGIVLRRDYLEACGISQTALAVMMGVPPRRINEIVHGLRAVTADTAVRLGAAIGPSARYWMGLQSDFDIERARARGVECEVRYPSTYGLNPDSIVGPVRRKRAR